MLPLNGQPEAGPRAATAARPGQAIMPVPAQLKASTVWPLGGLRPRGAPATSACRLHARVRRQGPRDARLPLPPTPEVLMQLEFTAVYRKVPEGYVAFVEELPGANTQGATLDEARENLREAVELTL